MTVMQDTFARIGGRRSGGTPPARSANAEQNPPTLSMELHAPDGLLYRPEFAARLLQPALRYLSAVIQTQGERIAARGREIAEHERKIEAHQCEIAARTGELASRDAELAQQRNATDVLSAELNHRNAEICRLAGLLAQREAEIARLAHALAQPPRLIQAIRDPRRALRYVLRRVRQTIRPARATPEPAPLHAQSPMNAEVETAVPPEAARDAYTAPRPHSPPTPAPSAPTVPADYRERMRARLARGLFTGQHNVVILAPPKMHEAASTIERCLEETGLGCTVDLAMPDQFPADLYLVLNPGEFAQLPPADRRIVWLACPGGAASAIDQEELAELAASLAVFDSALPSIHALQQRGIPLHQIFYVPLDHFDSAEAALADDSPMGLRHLLPRALHGCGVLDTKAFEHATRSTRLDAEHVVLCLPESLARFENAANGLRHGAIRFPGIRQLDGWKGTALSYRYLARRALAAGRTRLIVSEDDAGFGDDFAQRLATTVTYLNTHAGTWDVFSGLLTDLSEKSEVTAIDVRGEDVFLRLDSVIGMVFGIYGIGALEALAAYEFAGDDVMRHTIDRYLEALKPRCLTLFPPLVRHDDVFSSTLWTPEGRNFVSNEHMNPMIYRSQIRLLSKVVDRLGHTTPTR